MKSKEQILARIVELRNARLNAIRSELPAHALMAESRISELIWVLQETTGEKVTQEELAQASRGWLRDELEHAAANVAKWSPGMRKERRA